MRDGCAVLDVGAADGAMLDALSKRLSFRLSVSLERMPELARLIPKNGVCGTGLHLPFCDNVFDFVICSATRKHVKDSLALTREAARVLRPGGRLIVIDPHPILLRVGVWFRKFDPRWLFHFSYADEIAREFRAAGLRECNRETHMFVCCVGEKPATRAD